MPAFAIYFIPDAEDKFYQLGSAILGYDIRNKNPHVIPSQLDPWKAGIENGWVSIARPYGFHLTIGDAIDCDLSNINEVEKELEYLLSCFSKETPFILTQCENFVSFWGDKREVVFLRYNANVELMMFQAAIASSINPLGKGSAYFKSCLKNEKLFSEDKCQINRTKKYYAPYIFDSFRPHFTLFSPFGGKDHDQLEKVLTDIFLPFKEFYVNKICLLFQERQDSDWVIYREFER